MKVDTYGGVSFLEKRIIDARIGKSSFLDQYRGGTKFRSS